MASENISKHTLGLTQLQSGQGEPTHVSLKGSLYIDVLTSEYYKNIDGVSTWSPLVMSAATSVDTYVTGFTYNNLNKLTLSQNNGQEDISVYLNVFSGLTVNGIVSATTFYGSGIGLNNIFISGVTNLQNSLDLKTNLSDFVSHTGNTNNPHQTTFYNLISTAHTHTISDVIDLQTTLNSKFNISGGTITGNVLINGSLTATTYYGDGSNLTGLVTNDFYVTGGTYSNGVLTLNRQNGSITISGFTTETITAGENLIYGDLVYLSGDSKYYKASNSSESTSKTELRISLDTINSNNTGVALIKGKFITTGLVPGDLYIIGSTSGTITNTEPIIDGSIIRIVGTALNSTTLEFNPDQTYVEIGSSIPYVGCDTYCSSINSFYIQSPSTGITWNVSGNSTNYKLTLTANTTLNLSNVRNGDYGTIILTQDSGGNRTITLGTVNGASATHKVVNGGAGLVSLTTTANAIDILSFVYDGTNVYWNKGLNYT